MLPLHPETLRISSGQNFFDAIHGLHELLFGGCIGDAQGIRTAKGAARYQADMRFLQQQHAQVAGILNLSARNTLAEPGTNIWEQVEGASRNVVDPARDVLAFFKHEISSLSEGILHVGYLGWIRLQGCNGRPLGNAIGRRGDLTLQLLTCLRHFLAAAI